MPYLAPAVCEQPGCFRLSHKGRRCDQHRRQRQAEQQEVKRQGHRDYNAKRPESDKFYGTAVWRKCRDAYIAEHPLCCNCEDHGLVVPADLVDHIIPYKEDPDLGTDHDNLRSLCIPCHNRIGAKAKGGG